MARKSVPQAAATAAADPAITDETEVVAADTAAPAPDAPTDAPAGDPTITDETVVVTGEDVQPVAMTDPPPSQPTSEPAAAEPVQASGPRTDVVVVTCGLSSGRRRAGRRWEAGTTRVPASEISDAELVQLHADPVLRVSIEAA